MNKLFIVMLAVCLVTVHGLVKRDAPTTPDQNELEEIQKQLQDLAKTIGDNIKDNFNADKLKEGFSKTVDEMKKAIDNLQPAKS